MKLLTIISLAANLVVLGGGLASAQLAPQPQVLLTPGSLNSWNADWTGVPNRVYFLQVSVDLVHWLNLPAMAFGSGAKSAVLQTEGSEKFFFRLKYYDNGWITSLQGAKDADFDGDGLSNWNEVNVHFTDPFSGDSDGDELDDSWEVMYGLDPVDSGSTNFASGASGDPDGDGYPNLVELLAGANPMSAADAPPRLIRESRTAGEAWTERGPRYLGDLDVIPLPGQRDISYYANYDTPTRSISTAGPLAPNGVRDFLINSLPFPAEPTTNATRLSDDVLYDVASQGYIDYQQAAGPEGYGALHVIDSSAMHSRIWERRPLSHTATGPCETPYLLVRELAPEVGPITYESSAVTFQIAQGETQSSPIDFVPVATTSHLVITSFLIDARFTTVPDAQEGPDKAHVRNLAHISGAPYGAEWKKCVSKVWEPGMTLDLTDYVQGVSSTLLKQIADWRVDGVLVYSHELNYGGEPDENEHKHCFVELVSKSDGVTIDRLVITIVPRSTKFDFDEWYLAEKADLAWLAELPPMFSAIETTVDPEGYLPRPDRNFNPYLYGAPHAISSYYHPGAAYELRSFATLGNHGHQVCYDAGGIVLTSRVRSGSADKQAPFPAQLDGTKHREEDVKPFVWALQLDGNPAKGAGTPLYASLTAPMLHEGAYLKKYLEVRPPVPNSKPQLTPGATP